MDNRIKLTYNGSEYGIGDLFIYGSSPFRVSGFMVTVARIQVFGIKYINGKATHLTIDVEGIAKLIRVKDE